MKEDNYKHPNTMHYINNRSIYSINVNDICENEDIFDKNMGGRHIKNLFWSKSPEYECLTISNF